MKSLIFFATGFLICACATPDRGDGTNSLALKEEGEMISVYRSDGTGPLLVQNAGNGIRPYIHPIMAPDGNGELTEYSPAHHKHQTGLYWGLKQVNGRDYFMNWRDDYWRKVSSGVLDAKGSQVRWQTVYDLLNEADSTILTETQTWSFSEEAGTFWLELTWEGKARRDVTMGKFYVGGLFLRMPWRKGIEGEVVNAAGQRNGEAEGQRAIWNDIGIKVEGRADLAHIAIFDHPDNRGFPIPWRVDNELGVGPSLQILGDWTIRQGKTATFRYRLVVYTGDRDDKLLNNTWKQFVCESF